MIYDRFISQFQVFLIVFVRFWGLFLTVPFFSGQGVPVNVKNGLIFFLSFACVPMVLEYGIKAPDNLIEYGVVLLTNFVIGAGIGFFMFIIITAFQVSAQIFSIPMGLGMNEVVDPMSQLQVPALGNVLGVMILFLLFRIDAHLYMLQMLIESFGQINDLERASGGIFLKGAIQALVIMFDVSMKISFPLIAMTLLLDFAMGLISRVAPQFNIMIMGFNIKLILSFLLMFMLLPTLVNLGEDSIKKLIIESKTLLAAFKGAQ